MASHGVAEYKEWVSDELAHIWDLNLEFREFLFSQHSSLWEQVDPDDTDRFENAVFDRTYEDLYDYLENIGGEFMPSYIDWEHFLDSVYGK